MSNPFSFARIRTASIGILSLTLLFVACAAGQAQARPDSKAVLSPVAFRVIDRPTPVRGADGRMHLSYELQVINQSQLDVTVTKVGTRAQNNVLGKPLTGAAIAERMRLNDGGTGATLTSGSSATIFMDAAYGVGRKRPARISHGIALAWTDPTSGEAVKLRFAGVTSRVASRPPVRLRPPLRGGKWVAVSGCCTLNPHRGATLAIDGTVRVPERFAIDFVQLNAEDRLFSGPIGELSSYEFYGTPVHAAAKGRVVRVQENLPEQIPGTTPADPTIQTAGGNHVVIAMGKGRFAFYAHLETGSVRVKRGDRVKAGQVIGLLGNTGNSDAPHLHFHVMDSASPLQSSGLPYTFTRFQGQGFIEDPVKLTQGEDPGIERRLIGPHRNQLALDNQIVSFGN